MALKIATILLASAGVASAIPPPLPCREWSGPLKTDIPGAGMGGTKEHSLDACKKRCEDNAECQAAQYCDGGSMSCSYNGFGRSENCFIYNNQADTGSQLKAPMAHTKGSFVIYKYTHGVDCGSGTWSPKIYRDIQGTGLGGTYQQSLPDCKLHCAKTWNCQAAQYGTGTYPCREDSRGCNCYLYDNQNLNSYVDSTISGFYMYKYNRNGCGDHCCKDNVQALLAGSVCSCGSDHGGCCSDALTPKVFWYDTCPNLEGPSEPPKPKPDEECNAWGHPLKTDIPGAGLGGYYKYSLSDCKKSCVDDYKCQAAQYCSDSMSTSCAFTGYSNRRPNCFLYDSQLDTAPQLKAPTAHVVGAFVLYKYTRGLNCGKGTWSPPIYRDIEGTGLGGTYQETLADCKLHCANDWRCKTAQYGKETVSYSCTDSRGCNCYTYNNQYVNRYVPAPIKSFYLYKYNRDGCGDNCCPDNVQTEVGSASSCNCGGVFHGGCCSDGITPKVRANDPCVDLKGDVVFTTARRLNKVITV